MKPNSTWTQEEKDQFWADQNIEPKDILEEFDEDINNWPEEDFEDEEEFEFWDDDHEDFV